MKKRFGDSRGLRSHFYMLSSSLCLDIGPNLLCGTKPLTSPPFQPRAIQPSPGWKSVGVPVGRQRLVGRPVIPNRCCADPATRASGRNSRTHLFDQRPACPVGVRGLGDDRDGLVRKHEPSHSRTPSRRTRRAAPALGDFQTCNFGGVQSRSKTSAIRGSRCATKPSCR